MAPSPPSPIRILIVDDHAVMRMGLRLLLEGQPDLLVVGEAATSAEALAAATCGAPDVILLDLDLGGESAIDSLPALRTAAPQARVLLLTGVRDPALHRQAVRCGAMGLIRKETAAGVLLQAIRKVQAGEVWLELDEGTMVHLRAGDTVVQNGTRHAWRNRGSEPCQIVVFMVGVPRKPSGIEVARNSR